MLVARLQALNTENTLAEADRIAKEAVYREAKDGTLPEVQVSAQSTDLTKDVETLRQAKANLALVAATYGDQHPEYHKAAAQVEEARAALDESRQNVATRIAVDYRQTLVRERMLSAAVAETKQEVDDLTSQSFNYLQLKHEADAAERVYDDLFAKIKQSGINSELQNNIIRLADSARPAARPIFPNWALIVLCSMAFFSLSCATYVISAELTDVTAKEAEEVEKALGVPVVCALPRFQTCSFNSRPVRTECSLQEVTGPPARRLLRRERTPPAWVSHALSAEQCAQERADYERLTARRKINSGIVSWHVARGTRQAHAVDRRRSAPTID